MSVDRTPDARPSPTSATLTVEADAASLARGVTALAATHGTTKPARSHPANRPRLPALELGEETLEGADSAPEPATTLEVVVPPSVAAVFVTAPLAYYCCASVRTADVDRPVIHDPDRGFRHELASLPRLQEDCASLLRRVFFLDCLVRDVTGPGREPTPTTPGEPGSGPRQEDTEAIDLDAEALRAAPPGQRLERYLAVCDEWVTREAPAWHLASYVVPRPDHVHCLPHLLETLSLVYLPRATRCEPDDLLSHTLDDALATRGTATAASRTRLKPDLDESHVHAWLAPGTPLGAFKATPGAFRHRRAHETRRPRATGVVKLIVTEPEMVAEAEAAVAAYETSPEVDSVEAHTVGTRADVREALVDSADLVHYVGHCDDEGLRCRDGWLDLGSLDAVRTPAFLLNACGSYEQGLQLLEAGSVAGAVTLGDVLDDHAATVGRTLARLLLRGFELAPATRLARRRILMGADYVVVGDGTFRVYEPRATPTVLRVTRTGGQFRVRSRGVATDRTGHAVDPPLAGPPALNGDEAVQVCPREELVEVLDADSMPVIFDGELHWSEDLVREFGGERN